MKTWGMFWCAFALAGVAGAQTDLDRILNAIERQDSRMEALHVAFLQTVRFSGVEDVSTVSGEVVFGRDGRLRLSRKEPSEQITVSDGKTVWVYNPVFGQVWVGGWKNWVEGGHLPKGLLPGLGYLKDLRARFDLRLGDADEFPDAAPDTAVLLAVPKEPGMDYELDVHVSMLTWLPVLVDYRSPTARMTTIITGTEPAPVVSRDTFRFVPPRGTDVIRLD